LGGATAKFGGGMISTPKLPQISAYRYENNNSRFSHNMVEENNSTILKLMKVKQDYILEKRK